MLQMRNLSLQHLGKKKKSELVVGEQNCEGWVTMHLFLSAHLELLLSPEWSQLAFKF